MENNEKFDTKVETEYGVNQISSLSGLDAVNFCRPIITL